MPDFPRETVLCHYRYDPLDRLVDCAPFEQARIQRFYCKSRLATEVQGAVQRSVFQHDDQLLAQLRREGVGVDTSLLATDQQRSVLNVLDANRPHPLAYTPYGHRPAGNGLLSLLGFNGERSDPVTGHYLLGNGYRGFSPVLMRFNSPDSLSPFGEGGLNAYSYCAGDPVNGTDPSGHISIKPFMSIFFKNPTGQKYSLPKGILRPEALTIKQLKNRARHVQRRKKIKDTTTLIKENERALQNQNAYTVTDDITDLTESLRGYEMAKRGYHFEEYPNPYLEYRVLIDGKPLLDTSHFDITISHFTNLNSVSAVKKYNYLNSTAPLEFQHIETVRHIRQTRAEYIRRFTGIDLFQKIRQ
ncbi:RHS repeat-associated core domain-containing protein [Pseudomonas kilonensis]|uniref:RHS repeat-associated core domain-containing protein n=1 Tax=Pseudomonas kilonensis TaxID=132476 RepID=UPI003399D7D8